jgi:hypothetical protein
MTCPCRAGKGLVHLLDESSIQGQPRQKLTKSKSKLCQEVGVIQPCSDTRLSDGSIFDFVQC